MLKSFFSRLVLLVGAISIASFGQLSSTPQTIGYYENWAQYRGTTPKGFPSDFSDVASFITVFNYAFLLFNISAASQPVTVTNDWLVYNSEWNDATLLQQAVNLKQINPNMKIMISIGGWNFNDPSDSLYGNLTYTFFSNVCANSTGTNRAAFIASIVDYCDGETENNQNTVPLDGFDMDWEVPGQTTRGGSGSDYANLLTFISALRTALKNNTRAGQPYPLSLSMAVPASLPASIAGGVYPGGTLPNGSPYAGGTVVANDETSYFIWYGIVAKFCDWINVMSYDVHGPWESTTGYNAPLYPANQLGVAYAVNLWTNPAIGNVPASQVMIGIPAYAHTFAGVQFPSGSPPYGAGNSFSTPGPAGPYTRQPGMLAYYEVHNDVEPPGYFEGQAVDTNAQTAFAWSRESDAWASYDTPVGLANGVPSSVVTKAQYILDNQLGGAMIYAISQDIFWMGSPIVSSVASVFYPQLFRDRIQRNEPR